MPTEHDTRTLAKEWTYDGYDCQIVIVNENHYCGYVKTELDGDYTDYNTDVHGGLTYGTDSDGWIGFDCAHGGDVCYDGDERLTRDSLPVSTVWRLEGVKREVESLVEEIKRIEQ